MHARLLAATVASAPSTLLAGQARTGAYISTTFDDPSAGAGGPYSLGINGSGRITGRYYDATGYHCFVGTSANFTKFNYPRATAGTIIGIDEPLHGQ
jgi:hypothetical protein